MDKKMDILYRKVYEKIINTKDIDRDSLCMAIGMGVTLRFLGYPVSELELPCLKVGISEEDIKCLMQAFQS